jgi:phospholipid/cholesterol/gamma-HCH transport system substrate-binding protein
MTTTGRNIRLGIFVVAGSAVLIAGLYFIGSRRNLFGSSFRISAQFHNVNGLMSGNNVRFAGIDVGTVERVDLVNDSLVNVVMIIEAKARPHIRKNAVATIGTEGLMGNKLVNINIVPEPAPSIEAGDTLQSLRPIEGDEMLRTLSTTNENVKVMSQNLRSVSQRFEREKGLWALLTDSLAAANVKAALQNARTASVQASLAAADLHELTESIRRGEGAAGALLSDTLLAGRMRRIVSRLEDISDTTAAITGDLSVVSARIRNGEGAVGVLMNDSAFARSLQETMRNVEQGTKSFEENMEALRHSWPFKRYFKKQQKAN